MDRRTFIGAMTGGFLAAPRVAKGQQAGKVAKIGYLTGSSVGALDAFKLVLGEHGYIEGRNIAIEIRSAEGRVERLSTLATELAHFNVDVFLVTVNRVAVAVREIAPKTPIVMTRAEEPVRLGLVKSLARPGGNITGIAILAGPEIYGKNLELLKAVLPGRVRIVALFNTTSSVNALWLKATEEAACKLGVRLVPIGVRSPADFDQAFALMKQAEATGFVVLGGRFAGHLSFEELRTQSLLRDEAVTAADPDFSRRIRAALVQRPTASRVRCLKAGRGAPRGPND